MDNRSIMSSDFTDNLILILAVIDDYFTVFASHCQ